MSSLILAISSSIDSLGIGITYGIKNTKISYISKVILFAISFFTTIISIWFGDTLKNIFSESIAKIFGSSILILIGLFMFFQALKKDKKSTKYYNNDLLKNTNLNIKDEQKIFSFFIKFLGITIKIIKNPSSSDFNNSNLIDPKEAFFLGLALSIDSFCIGIGGSIIGINFTIFPLLISIFQLIFLSIGNYLGHKLNNCSKIPNNIWSILSSILLIIIGITKFLF